MIPSDRTISSVFALQYPGIFFSQAAHAHYLNCVLFYTLLKIAYFQEVVACEYSFLIVNEYQLLIVAVEQIVCVCYIHSQLLSINSLRFQVIDNWIAFRIHNKHFEEFKFSIKQLISNAGIQERVYSADYIHATYIRTGRYMNAPNTSIITVNGMRAGMESIR